VYAGCSALSASMVVSAVAAGGRSIFSVLSWLSSSRETDFDKSDILVVTMEADIGFADMVGTGSETHAWFARHARDPSSRRSSALVSGSQVCWKPPVVQDYGCWGLFVVVRHPWLSRSMNKCSSHRPQPLRPPSKQTMHCSQHTPWPEAKLLICE